MIIITDKEAKILGKAIKRLHKENGTFVSFTRLKDVNPRRKIPVGKFFMSTIIDSFLVPYCWDVFRSKFMREREDYTESSIMASICLLNIIDFLNYNEFSELKKRIVDNEFKFIDGKIHTLILYNEKMPFEIEKKINEALTKYANFIEKGLYKHIITRLQMLRGAYRAH